MRQTFRAATLLLACAAVCSPVAARQLRRLAASELASARSQVDASILPEGASALRVEPDQAMRLSIDEEITLLPVRYAVQNPGGGSAPSDQCGLVLIPAHGPATLVITLGAGSTETVGCAGLRAMGIVRDRANRPVLALIYTAATLRESFNEAVILTDRGGGTYRPDEELSQWVGEHKDGRTIEGIRRLLAGRSHDRPLR